MRIKLKDALRTNGWYMGDIRYQEGILDVCRRAKGKPRKAERDALNRHAEIMNGIYNERKFNKSRSREEDDDD